MRVAVARELDHVADKRNFVVTLALEQGDGRHRNDDRADGSGSERGHARTLGADLNHQRVLFRLDAIMLERETRGEIGGAAELADADSLALKLGDRANLLLRHQIVHGPVSAIENRFQRQASRRQAQPGIRQPVILNFSRQQRVLRHGRNQPRQLDVESFVFKKSSVNRNEQRQVTHGIARQRKLNRLCAESVLERVPDGHNEDHVSQQLTNSIFIILSNRLSHFPSLIL